MACFETKFNIGDEVYFVDMSVQAPVGPVKITEIMITAAAESKQIRYHFSASSRREDTVFGTHQEALAACRNRNWMVAQIRQ